MILTGGQSSKVEVGKLGLGAGIHLVVESVADDGFAGQQPKEVVKSTTGVHNGVGSVVSVDNVVVRTDIGLLKLRAEFDVAPTSGVRAITGAGDACARAELGVLLCVVDDEVAIRFEVGVDSLDAGRIIGLEELALNVRLLVPSAHVLGSVEIGESGGVVAGEIGDGCVLDKLFECEFHVM